MTSSLNRLHFETNDRMMSLSSGPEDVDDPLLHVELAGSPRGYLARLKGDLVAETVGVL
jgi:hypothetical protein